MIIRLTYDIGESVIVHLDKKEIGHLAPNTTLADSSRDVGAHIALEVTSIVGGIDDKEKAGVLIGHGR